MEVFVRHLKVLWTSERMLGEIKLKIITHKVILGAVAALAGLFGLGMLNLAAFFGLEPRIGAASAALFIALANLVVAGIFLFTAKNLAPGPEVKLIEDVRDMALADIETEARAAQNEILAVRDEILAVRSTVSNLVKNPTESLLPKLLLPLIPAATQLIKNWDRKK
jgi:hypothetical protein